MDKIFIKNLNIDTIIGLYKHEQGIKQLIIIDIELAINAKAAASNDDISNTADYDEVIDLIYNICEQNRFKLIESLAECIASSILTKFNNNWVSVKITKPNAVNKTKDVGVMIERFKPEN